MRTLHWRWLVGSSLIGACIAVAVVLPGHLRAHDGFVSVVHFGQKYVHPARAHDFASLRPVEPDGHDGQFFYSLARQPMHLHDATVGVDRPRYRAQRILYPVLAWALHPSGGGMGLVVALFAVNIAGLVLGGLAMGAISQWLRGPPQVAIIFPLLPGSLTSLDRTVPDALAIALALGAIALDLHGRRRAAIVFGVLAVLAKEPMLLVLVGYAIWRRDRMAAFLAGIPAAVVAAWFVALHIMLPAGQASHEFVAPFTGLSDAIRSWSHGAATRTALMLFVCVMVSLYALWRGALRGPLGWPQLLQLVFIPLLSFDVLGATFDAERALLPLHALTVLLVVQLVTGAALGRDAADEKARPAWPRRVRRQPA